MQPEDFVSRLESHLNEHQRLCAQLATCLPAVVQCAMRLADCLRHGGKLLICGNGGSAADAQHFAAELVNRFETQRSALAAIALTTDTSALTAIANDTAFTHVFARQVQALGRSGDVLVALSTSGQSANVIAAVSQAQAQNLWIVALTGRDGGLLATQLRVCDIELRIVSQSTARIQEMHGLIIHCLCDLIEQEIR